MPENSVKVPNLMVIFGASGDLTQRKLLPALHNLRSHGLLSDNFAVIGVARDEMTHQKFRDHMKSAVESHLAEHVEHEHLDWLTQRLFYIGGDLRDAGVYKQLAKLAAELNDEFDLERNGLFYLAVPPRLFADIARQLGENGLAAQEEGKFWRRLVIEKPFGTDLESARALNISLRESMRERQIYRIDHYLGKETVQNLLVFRFANGIFEPVWNRRYVDHIQITVAEQLGVEHRASYYEHAGALRDMIPNHLFQLLALTAMEPPTSFEANAVRNEKGKVLSAIQPIEPTEVLNTSVRGQYGAGQIEGKKVPAYRDELNIADDSNTETYAAMKLLVDNWRWAGVPFYLRTGKRLARRMSEIVIQFKSAPFMMFENTPVDHLTPNQLILRMQPAEGIALKFGAKVPGTVLTLGNVNMDFCYADYFGTSPQTGYETLLYDCMKGDATLFQRADVVESAWAVVAPVLDVWSALPAREFPNYESGSWGPADSDKLLARDGRAWRLPER